MSECLGDNLIAGYLDGFLAPAEVDAVDAHIARCATCSSLLACAARGAAGHDSLIVTSVRAVTVDPELKDPAIGRTIDGRFLITGKIGRVLRLWRAHCFPYRR